jgi:hypothetical protein
VGLVNEREEFPEKEHKKGGHASHTDCKEVLRVEHGEKDDLPGSSFAFPKERKEPLIDAKHVRNAISRFVQVKDVSDAERDKAWRRVKSAAKKFDVEISEDDWRELSSKSKSPKR